MKLFKRGKMMVIVPEDERDTTPKTWKLIDQAPPYDWEKEGDL